MTATRVERNLWRIDLPSGRVPINYTLMRREIQGYGNDRPFLRPDHKVVIVDLAKFIELVEQAPPKRVVPCAANWSDEELTGMTEFLKPCPASAASVLMPIVGHYFRTIKKQQWPFWKSKEEKVFYADFTNGRHRTRFLEYGGAKTMPVEVNGDSVDFYMRTCGLCIEEPEM